jgi:hypothetical protein
MTRSLGCLMLMTMIAIAGQGVMAQGNGGPPPPPPGGGPNNTPLEIDPNFQPVESTYEGIGTITSGSGDATDNLSLTTACTSGERFVSGGSGVVIAEDESEWIVPMEMTDGSGSVDIFNTCTGNGETPNYLDDLETVVIDEEGEVITAYIFADNYFELFVNGTFVVRDTINFIPFNYSVVRFRPPIR